VIGESIHPLEPWSMIAVLSALTLSGYALYYLASEQSHPVWSAAHWTLGLAFPLLLVVHIVVGSTSDPAR
jgi:hypothetical protein